MQSYLPTQYIGKKHDISSTECYASKESAIDQYRKILAKLQDINHWNKISTAISAEFKHLNSQLEVDYTPPAIGNYIGIKVGLKNPLGNGWDWVKIVDLHIDTSAYLFYFTVQPCTNPCAPHEYIAHFYQNKTTNTFILRMDALVIHAEVHGRNIVANTDVPFLARTRNRLVGMGGMYGMGKVQWKALVDGLLK